MIREDEEYSFKRSCKSFDFSRDVYLLQSFISIFLIDCTIGFEGETFCTDFAEEDSREK